MVAAEARGRPAARQASSSLPWIGVDDPSDFQRLQAEHAVRLQETTNFQLGGPEKVTGANDPRHVLQRNGGLADLWDMDDGDILCHPILVPSYLQEFDVANAKVVAERNSQKTEVIHYVNDLDAAPLEWRIHEVQNMESGKPHQPHTASTRPHNPSGTAGCRNLRRGWAAVSRTALPGFHGGQCDASHSTQASLELDTSRLRRIWEHS